PPEREPALQVLRQPGPLDQPQLARGALRGGDLRLRSRPDPRAAGHQHRGGLGVVPRRGPGRR
ncbi:hypothetical protein IAE22_35890, partial [Bacillus sp. S34]|nr:hypothetical protein [Bacillus sp. S34]